MMMTLTLKALNKEHLGKDLDWLKSKKNQWKMKMTTE
jgi:hypothetical protein